MWRLLTAWSQCNTWGGSHTFHRHFNKCNGDIIVAFITFCICTGKFECVSSTYIPVYFSLLCVITVAQTDFKWQELLIVDKRECLRYVRHSTRLQFKRGSWQPLHGHPAGILRDAPGICTASYSLRVWLWIPASWSFTQLGQINVNLDDSFYSLS